MKMRLKPIDKKLFFFVIADKLDKVQECVDNGADVNAVDQRLNSPLLFSKSGAVARYLLDNGANVNWKNSLGDNVVINNARRLAAPKPDLTADAFIEIWREVKAYGVDALTKNYDGKGAIDFLDPKNAEHKRALVILNHQRIGRTAATKTANTDGGKQ